MKTHWPAIVILAAALLGSGATPAAAAGSPERLWGGPAGSARPQADAQAAVVVEAPECACDTGYDVAVTYSVSGLVADGVLEVYEDDLLVHAVTLTGFEGSATEVISVPGDSDGPHTWRAVLEVSGGGTSLQAEDSDVMRVCETPRLAGVPDQTYPFHSFNLHDYLTYGGEAALLFDVGAPYPPPPGWEVGISYDGTISVFAPADTPDSMDLTFHAWIECSPGIFCVSSDTAAFRPAPPGPVCPVDAGIDLEWYLNHEDTSTAPGAEIPVGTPLRWTYHVTNVGSLPLDHVVVGDAVLGTVCVIDRLSPGESRDCQATGSATAGEHVIRGKASGQCIAADGSKHAVRDVILAHYIGVLP
jgi:hypothetical protein